MGTIVRFPQRSPPPAASFHTLLQRAARGHAHGNLFDHWRARRMIDSAYTKIALERELLMTLRARRRRPDLIED